MNLLSYSERITAGLRSFSTDDLQEPNVETEFCSTGISLSLELRVDIAFSVLTCTPEYKKGEKNK